MPLPVEKQAERPASGDSLNSEKCGAVEKIPASGLGDDNIFRLFRGGAKAVLLEGDQRVHRLWKELVSSSLGTSDSNTPFWENSVLTFAENHIEGRDDVGDMVRFSPGLFGHLARKIVTYPDSSTGTMRLIPDGIVDTHQPAEYSQSTLRLAWDLATDVYRSAMPVDYESPEYAVSIQLLKYPDSAHSLQKMFGLLRDSAGPWTKLGQRLDSARALALGPFHKKYVRELFALLSLLPGVGRLLHRVNNRFTTHSRYVLGEDEMIVGPPHVDTARPISMLASDRDVVSTYVYDGQEWAKLPLTTESLLVFPGKDCEEQLSIPATVHRYTMNKVAPTSSSGRLNLTMLLAIVRRGLANDDSRSSLRNVS